MILGHLQVERYLKAVKGLVTGSILTDAKDRRYHQVYDHVVHGDELRVRRQDGNGDEVVIPRVIVLDEPLLAFFGLYSGDGAKGVDDDGEAGRILPTLSFSQKERYLVRFAVEQFRRLFPGAIRFTFSLGEDSAYFMDGGGRVRLQDYYTAKTGLGMPAALPLDQVRPELDPRDMLYLKEIRLDAPGTNEEHLAFYYQHKDAMEVILAAEKAAELATVGIAAGSDLRITASLRRPFKKGARLPGGSSRSDEIHLGGLNGLGELFLKMMHEIEDSILRDAKLSASGLVEWTDVPSCIGASVDILDFFTTNPFGTINGARPVSLEVRDGRLFGIWRQSSEIELSRNLRLDPTWCYIAGLYLAEGTTPKDAMFKMFSRPPGSMALGFTSSEGTSLELVLRALRRLFTTDDSLQAWKVKVGSQYFPELVVIGQKQGLPMLRGGESGDGKLRTMEISLSIRTWALAVADAPLGGVSSILRRDYSTRYSHVEPTGAGVARIDFWASSTLCRWYFPLLMYTVFGGIVRDPAKAFYA
jgi:hypothetical protein